MNLCHLAEAAFFLLFLGCIFTNALAQILSCLTGREESEQ